MSWIAFIQGIFFFGGVKMSDAEYMKSAIKLAQKGAGYVNPNPMVGAVIVKDGRIIGQGYHEMDLDELDITSAESKATYQEIKDYVLKEFGLKVSTLYISQIKRKCGIEVGEHYNIPQKENQKVPQCPKEKEDAIRAALEHFAMI